MGITWVLKFTSKNLPTVPAYRRKQAASATWTRGIPLYSVPELGSSNGIYKKQGILHTALGLIKVSGFLFLTLSPSHCFRSGGSLQVQSTAFHCPPQPGLQSDSEAQFQWLVLDYISFSVQGENPYFKACVPLRGCFLVHQDNPLTSDWENEETTLQKSKYESLCILQKVFFGSQILQDPQANWMFVFKSTMAGHEIISTSFTK